MWPRPEIGYIPGHYLVIKGVTPRTYTCKIYTRGEPEDKTTPTYEFSKKGIEEDYMLYTELVEILYG